MDKISVPVMLFILAFITAYFPGGVIAMTSSCRDREIDHWDWLFSVTIPFYGIAEALIC